MKLLTELYKIPAKTGNEEQIKSFIMENVKDIPMQVITSEEYTVFSELIHALHFVQEILKRI